MRKIQKFKKGKRLESSPIILSDPRLYPKTVFIPNTPPSPMRPGIIVEDVPVREGMYEDIRKPDTPVYFRNSNGNLVTKYVTDAAGNKTYVDENGQGSYLGQDNKYHYYDTKYFKAVPAGGNTRISTFLGDTYDYRPFSERIQGPLENLERNLELGLGLASGAMLYTDAAPIVASSVASRGAIPAAIHAVKSALSKAMSKEGIVNAGKQILPFAALDMLASSYNTNKPLKALVIDSNSKEAQQFVDFTKDGSGNVTWNWKPWVLTALTKANPKFDRKLLTPENFAETMMFTLNPDDLTQEQLSAIISKIPNIALSSNTGEYYENNSMPWWGRALAHVGVGAAQTAPLYWRHLIKDTSLLKKLIGGAAWAIAPQVLTYYATKDTDPTVNAQENDAVTNTVYQKYIDAYNRRVREQKGRYSQSSQTEELPEEVVEELPDTTNIAPDSTKSNSVIDSLRNVYNNLKL